MSVTWFKLLHVFLKMLIIGNINPLLVDISGNFLKLTTICSIRPKRAFRKLKKDHNVPPEEIC